MRHILRATLSISSTPSCSASFGTQLHHRGWNV